MKKLGGYNNQNYVKVGGYNNQTNVKVGGDNNQNIENYSPPICFGCIYKLWLIICSFLLTVCVVCDQQSICLTLY